jgi:hypothetical protein
MRFLLRQDNRRALGGGGGDGGDGSDSGLNSIRAEGEDLLSAADAHIQRTLGNGNSETFLRQARQQGGE